MRMEDETVIKETPEVGLSRLAISGVAWQVVANLIRFGGQFIIGIALARLLPPEDFGIVGIATIATGFAATMATLGLGAAVIQRKEVTERHLRVCQTASLGMSFLVMLALQFSAGAVGDFFNDERVTPVLQVLALTFLLSGFSVTAKAVLTRRMEFRTIIKIEMLSSIAGFGGVSISMAAAGCGYWSLVGGTLVQMCLSAIMSYSVVRNSLRPLVAAREIKDLLGFGAGISAEKIINYWALQGDYFVVGRLMNTVSLGYYTRAYMLMQLPQKFIGMALSRALFPAASAVQSDAVRFRRAYTTSLRISLLMSVPMTAGIVVLAPEIINTLYGKAWRPAIVILQVLATFGVFRMSYNNVTAFIHASGRTAILVGTQLVYAVLVVGGCWVAIPHAGLIGAAWAVGAAILAMWIMVLIQANIQFNVVWRDFLLLLFRSTLPGVLLGVALFVGVFALRQTDWSDLAVLVLSGFAYVTFSSYVVIRQLESLKHPEISRMVAQVRRHVGGYINHVSDRMS